VKLIIEEKPKKEPELLIFLSKYDDEVRVRAKETDGRTWSLLTISSEGVKLWPGIPARLGLAIDQKDQLLVDTHWK
jgi:hypothetical protein